ncbi:MAG TPA: Ig-like domain-containing protein, partial [Kofleriaceae bacterium]|nr:Ig-like domain-containing protein [Kofleriaceae bacterium]
MKFVSGFVMLVVLLAVAGGLLAACGDNLRVGISIDPHAVSLPVGVSSNIVVTTDGATGDAPVFKADHPDIASVSYGHGTLTVTGVAVGTTRVSATFHGEVVDVDVTVTDAQLVGLALNTAALTLPIGLDGPLTVVARYTDGSQVDVTSQVTFSVDDGAIGKIDHGAFHALKAGATIGHAAFRGLTADFSITVIAAILTALEVAPIEPRLAVGLAVDLAATGLFSDGSALDLTTAVTWSSADPTTASVSATGRALASKPGTVDITAAVGEIHGVAHLTVTGAHVNGLAIDPATATIPVTSNLGLHASAALDDGTAADVTTQVTWQSSDPAIVTIDARGNAHGVALGSATISADLGTLGHVTASVTVTGAVLQAITITPDPLTLPALVIGHLTATGTFSDGVPRDVTAQAVWTSDAPLTATVVGGVVVGLVPGTATVHAKVGGLTGDGVVHVTSAVLQTITVTSPTPTLPIGTTTQLAARATFSDGSTFDVTSQAVWSSSHGDHIAVSNAGARGLATAIGAGGSTITARLAGVAGALDLTATTATLTQIDVSPATVTLPVGSTQQLTATGRFSDGTILDLTAQATWTSSAPAIAAVASDGTVTGAAAGDATITARVGAIAGTRTVHVTSALLMAIQVTPAAVSVPAGLTTPLAAIARFSDGSTLDVTATAMWTSSAPAIATVSNAAGSRGVVTGKAAGSATITAALDGQTASSTVTVSAATLTEIQLTPAVLDLPVGTTGTLVATGVFSDGTTVDLTSQVAFTSSNAGVATVSAGAVAGVAPGSATITATLAGVSATATVHVGGAALTAITIDPPTATVPLLATTQLTATGVFSDASTLDVTAQATWASSNPLVAAVSNAAGTRGQVTGLLPGSATISATINGVSATATITVTAALLTGIQVSPAALHLPAGLSAPLSVIGTFSDGSTADITTQATFASNDPATATVSAGGAVLAVTPGAATITAAVGLATATATINVTAASLQQVVVNPGVLNLPSGTTGQLTAVGVFSDGSHQDLTAIATWTSSAPTTAAASNVAGAQGKVTASSVGTATITATIGGGSSTVAGSATVTVTSATITGLAIDPTNPQVPLLGTAQLTATATFSDGTTSDVTPQATWSSANPLVAAVSNAAGTRGKLSALLPGTAQITATFNGQSATTLATVTLAVLVSTEITPSSLSLPAGHTGAVQVVGHYSDGSTQDLTAQATFSSSNPAVASIASGGAGGSAGVVTANAPGAATITATIGLVSATASVTVSAATLQAVAIAPATLTLPLGQTGALTATGTFSDGTTADVTQTATWTTSAPLVAGVGNLALAGKVIALVPGTATITATIGTTTATATVTVTAATLESVAVTPGAPSVAIGGTAQLTATGTFSDGTTADVTAQTTFTSSNPGVVSVSNAAGTRGKITGVALGTATITATDGGSTTSVTVSVTPATLISAAIDAGTGSVAAGTTLALGVIGTFSDGTTADLTAQASFASSAPAVATVSAAGVVTGVATGDATITATVAGVTATAVV